MTEASSPAPRFRKSRFRLIAYIFYLFRHEFIRGNAAQRRRFIGRFARRLLQRLGYYGLQRRFFMLRLKAASLNQPADLAARQWRQRNWLYAIAGLEAHAYLKNWVSRHEVPHILVLGMGSVGDILQITPVLRALRDHYPDAEICLLHRSPSAKAVLYGNQTLNSIALADFHHFRALKRAVAAEGVADLVVEIASISYVLSYTRAPAAERHPQIDRVMPGSFFAKADAERARWRRHPPVFPRKDDKFVWPQEWRGYQFLDVLGATGNLPIDRHAALDFIIAPGADAIVAGLPGGQRYITVQNGVDADVAGWAKVTGQRPTKLLPQRTWIETVRLLRGQGMTVVQLGTLDDEWIDGVTLDLRGKTTLAEAAALLKQAQCHVGTEGGLVHLAYAVGTRSVVTFGPTSVEFLGYPRNINLVASDCTSCWWTTKDWFIYCPRGLAEPECMISHRADTIVAAVMQVIAEKV